MSFVIKQPVTKKEFKQYYHLRWKILRAPWQQPEGSEIDDIEDQCFHVIAVTTDHTVIGVARLQFNSKTEAQIRYMAVDESFQHKGIGRELVNHIETRAIEVLNKEASNKQISNRVIILDARETAVDFYLRLGYQVTEKSYLLFDLIQHYRMVKKLQ